MRNWLKEKYVVLTGASGGIGRNICKLLVLKYGAKVIGIGRSEAKMLSLKTELGKSADAFSYHIFDVGEKDAWKDFRENLVAENIYPALLINNAGAFPSFRKVSVTSSDTVERILKTNFYSAVYSVEEISSLLRGDKKDKPAIVNISSSAALCTVVGTGAYSASKSALKGYTEALQMEEKGKKYVGIVYPGTTKTELFREDKNTENSALDLIAMPAEKMAKKIVRKILKKRKRAVLGWDAKLMNFTAKVMPVKGLFLIRNVMKASHSKVFSEVFRENREEKQEK